MFGYNFDSMNPALDPEAVRNMEMYNFKEKEMMMHDGKGGCGCGCGMGPKMPMMGMAGNECCERGCVLRPVCERPIEKCVHKCFVHECPHICPIRTKIINHHIYKHTYCPQYSCCEENEIRHVNEGSCCSF